MYKADSNSNTSALQHPKTKTLALFDFDGTITSKDTLIEFTAFYRGRYKYLFGMVMLAPVLALYSTRLMPNWKSKQHFLSRYFKGERMTEFDKRCHDFTAQVLPALIRPEALQTIEKYRKQNVTMAVVTASAENWVKPWCDQYGITCLATKLEVKNGIITGKISGKNCYGDEKACRIKEHFNLSEFEEIIAYGDSRGDNEMLQLAHNRFYKPFRSS